ncbi:MAG TPA: hypothetical protein PKC60_02905 [Hydrogenophaga sp.]|uniref:PhaM family polyhydroxyalkanoate granule multifunctional regulatory protein n=1 Tax=Hydrogenophaga sp. TaxID=1904254 RepID=UPI002C6F2709|nr:PhaM family polyhydroxyalkanoate granule multifunctional regulatory protein [Hydrogenophaga sp.]HMN92158.1 hypothetical protein [Hydrogenophaga sp.]
MSETSGSGFGKFVPGFDFLQNLAGQAADGVAQGLGKSIPQLPNLGNWVAPTFNVEDLEKRIEELKAVHFWLDQNAKALGATIQALEVQKMTLATLQTMNFSLGDVANALKLKAADTVAGFTGRPAGEAVSAGPEPAVAKFAGLEIPPRTYGATAAGATTPAPPKATKARKARPRKTAAPAVAGAPARGVGPRHWWGALTQQFQGIAANALKDAARQTTLDGTRHMASGLTEQAVKTATGVAGKAADTVARNVGTAVGMGQAAARAVGGAARGVGARTTAPVPSASRKVTVKAAPKKRGEPKPVPAKKQAPRSVVPGRPLGSGDWPLPTAFFPGLQPAASPAVAKKAPAKKASARAPSRRRG